MILRLKDEELVIISDDSMDAAYLNHIFNGEIKVFKDTIMRKTGFHDEGEQEVRITLSRVK